MATYMMTEDDLHFPSTSEDWSMHTLVSPPHSRSTSPRKSLPWATAQKASLKVPACLLSQGPRAAHACFVMMLQKENTPPALALPSPRGSEGGPSQQSSPSHLLKARLAKEAQAFHQQHRRTPPPPPPASSTQSKAVQAASRRRAAAEGVESLTGFALPTASDPALRGALRDGVLLCRILNILRPSIIPKV